MQLSLQQGTTVVNTPLTSTAKLPATGRNAALVVAAGQGSRIGGDMPKQYQHLAGRAILRHAIDNLRLDPRIDTIQVVIDPDHDDLYQQAVADLDLPPTVCGGDHRQASVMNGLQALAQAAPKIVLIHDAARPFIDSAVLDRLFTVLERHPGAIAALPVVDSMKRGTQAVISGDVARDGLWRAQTPQAFHFAELFAAYQDAAGKPGFATLTDDAGVARAAGMDVALVTGDEALFKITTPQDMLRARHYCLASEQRLGQGFDVHRFGAGDAVTLAGVRIPHSAGLVGHSDADVALHALTDAILGAIGGGDIGTYFPPSEDQWKNADSAIFLAHAGALVRQQGGQINNLDLTIICEQPRIGPHRAAMQARIAEILGLQADRINVKATTTERLGFTGRGEGIAAMAICAVNF